MRYMVALQQHTLVCSIVPMLAWTLTMLLPAFTRAEPLDHIRVSDDRTHFVRGESAERFIVWGVNYDHDHAGRLLDEYWIDEWPTVVEDFGEIKALGANCVRIHLQLGMFLDAPDTPNGAALAQLAKLVQLAEDEGLYLDVTGLACYHKQNIPAWYDKLSEQDRWKAQAVFWEAVARTCQDSPAIFCYDLMNEPILPGKEPESDWLAGELGGKFFVQRLALELKDRTREQVAEAWVNTMVDAIRKHDPRHMITVGTIPWVFVFGGGENRKTTRLSDSGDVRPLASGDARLWADPGSFSLSTTRAEGLALMIVIHRRHLAPTPTNKQRFAQSCPAHSTASRCFIASPEHRHKPE